MAHARWGVLILGLAIGGCSDYGDRELGAAIVSQYRRGSGTVLEMQVLAPFEWERLHVFPPYSTAEEIEHELGFPCPREHRARIEERDDVALLLFVRGRFVAQHLAHNRGRGDFAGLHRDGGHKRTEAVFRVESCGAGNCLVWRGAAQQGDAADGALPSPRMVVEPRS